MTLPRAFRFSSRAEVRLIARRGRRFETELGRVAWARSARPGASPILFVVSTRVSKKSTERNRIRRQLAEVLRNARRAHPFAVAAIVHVHPAVAGLSGERRRALARDLARRLASLARL